jgi:MFS family permease
MFGAGLLSAITQTVAWVVIFFFASAAASSAYLTASEIFPLETRALAIACFYALGTAIGGSTSPLLFGWLIESGSAWHVSFGYGIAALLLLLAAVTELKHGVDAERKSLESIAEPQNENNKNCNDSGRREGVNQWCNKAVSICRAPRSGCLTSTGIGLLFGSMPFRMDGLRLPFGLSISVLRSCNASDARSNVLLPAAALRKLSIFFANVVW